MKNLKKDYTFWELVGYSKKIYYVLKISQILEEEKIRKDEVKINRSKNHKFSELSTKELTNIMFIYIKIFNKFCKEFVCNEDSKLIISITSEIFLNINYILE